MAGISIANPTYCGFKISVAANISTQILFAITILDYSSFTQMSFFVILLGQDAAGYIQTFFFDQICNLTSTNAAMGHPATSVTLAVNTTIPAPYNYGFFLSFFRMVQVTTGGTLFAAGVNDLGSTSQTISFSYYVDAGSNLL
jgi:hypothetical protein